MSGIAGILDLQGKPVNVDLLQSMTAMMARRGPDAQDSWSEGHVGLGNTLLHTSIDTPATVQPCSLDGSTWITADARIDGREALRTALGEGNGEAGGHRSDAQLILAAYHKWGRACVHHLLGDFSFVIWDGERRRLFCARDHFGIKPFYFCRTADQFLFANSMDPLRLHPQVSAALNDQTVADLLLYGFSIHPELSIFADVQKLPPAHTLTVDADGRLQCRRYWRLPVERIRHFKRAEACIEQFNDLWQAAVEDRLCTDRVGILMSGGVDSTSLAAQAKRCLADRFEHFDLRAFTFVYQWLLPSQEADFARQAADVIGIPVHPLPVDAYGPYEVSAAARAMKSLLESSFGQPTDPAAPIDATPACRVGICGYGGDELFHPGFTDLKAWMKNIHWPTLLWASVTYWRTHRRLPAIGLRTAVRKKLGKDQQTRQPFYPPWLNRDFERRLDLRQQWQRYCREPQRVDTPRSAAYNGLAHPLWHNLFEAFDPGMTGIPAELRYPFLDLRLIRFCLQLPPVPWCVDKWLLRSAVGQQLPESISMRPKTPLAGFPDYQHLLHGADAEKTIEQIPEAFSEYIDMRTYRRIARQPYKIRPGEHMLITHPLRLARWLHHLLKIDNHVAGRSLWQNDRKSKTQKSPIIPPDCGSMEISTA